MFRTDKRGVLRLARWERWAWLVHGFSTRRTGDFLDWPADDEISSAFGADGCGFGSATLRQVHSDRWVRADGPFAGNRPEADAVVTNRPGVLVGVRTADCVPVLLVDPARHTVAAVHAGWRGVAAEVLPKAVRALASEFGSRPADVEAVVGPGIGACCFEVGEEVASRFSNEFVRRDRPRPHVDLVSALERQLGNAGVSSVAACGECTSCGVDRYFSHRAERGKAGRMLAVAGLTHGGER